MLRHEKSAYNENEGVYTMNDTERIKRRQRSDKRRRKQTTAFMRNIFLLVLIAAAAAFCMKGLKPDENKQNTISQSSTLASQVKASEAKTVNDRSAASQRIVKYSFERPRMRQGAEIKNRLLELNGKYPGFQEICDNMDKYPESLLIALGNNPDMLDFVKGYLTEPHTANGKITKEEMSSKIPLFIQWDKRWGYVPYGDDNIALSGCAPTCISMVAVALTKNEQTTPDKVAAYSHGYYQPNVGTAWSIMTEGVKTFGIRGEQMSLNKNKIFNALENGNPIICSMGQGDFTAAGHFIVLAGVKDGKLVINDPNSTIRSDMLWNYEEIQGQIKNLWVFYKR